jgi:RNA polymerase sigma-70 factor (sigma-E family)
MFLLVVPIALPAGLWAREVGVIVGVIVTGGCLLFVHRRGLDSSLRDCEPVLAAPAGPAGSAAPDVRGSAAGRPASAADDTVTALYAAQYRSLVRMAVLLVGDMRTAEEVVQDCFVGMHRAFWRLRDSDKALHYLRRSVVNRSRSVMRHRMVAGSCQPKPHMPSAEHGAIALLAHAEVISALRSLPQRQREAIVLRFYLDLSEEQAAAAMKISRGAVRTHTARAESALRSALDQHR